MTSELCDEIVDGAINLVEVISNVAHHRETHRNPRFLR